MRNGRLVDTRTRTPKRSNNHWDHVAHSETDNLADAHVSAEQIAGATTLIIESAGADADLFLQMPGITPEVAR